MSLSYGNGSSEVALLGETIGENLARSAARWPDLPALTSCHQGLRWSYRELRRASRNLPAA